MDKLSSKSATLSFKTYITNKRAMNNSTRERPKETRIDQTKPRKRKASKKNRKANTKSKGTTNAASIIPQDAIAAEMKGATSEINSKGTKDEEKDDFDGNYFHDFYLHQGDYSKEELEEKEEIQHAKEIDDHIRRHSNA